MTAFVLSSRLDDIAALIVHEMFLPNHWSSVQTARMQKAGRNWIEETNWLAHRWPIHMETYPYGQWTVHVAKIGDHRIGQTTSRGDYDAWLGRQRPACLARLIAERPAVHPPVALVVAGEYRLGRIPAELWCGYDATPLLDLPDLTILSAKVRAVFPDWPKALIRVVRRDVVKDLGLRPAPDARGPRLRAVA